MLSFQEAVGDTLEELWISYNFIEKLKGIHVMKKLKILYMSNNLVKDWGKLRAALASLLRPAQLIENSQRAGLACDVPHTQDSEAGQSLR